MHTPKRIIICCDGTWNGPDIDPTNVVKLVRSIKPTAADGTQQVVFYDQGVGTGGTVDRLLGGTVGKGLAKNVLDCYRFLVHNYEDKDEIYCFGFSRGAYTARAFAGLVYAIGLMEKSELEHLPKAYHYYRTPPKERPNASYDTNVRPDIRMIGVWDTVGALGAPTPMLGKLTSPWVGFFDTHLSSIVKHGYHAMALDEERAPFKVNPWTGSLHPDQVVEQCWFRGVHSDIGGGYKESGLSDIALLWMADKAEALGLDLDRPYLERMTNPNPRMKAHDSFSAAYHALELFKAGRHVRRVYGDQAEPPINITVHDSVMDLVRAGEYQPTNPDFPMPEAAVRRAAAAEVEVPEIRTERRKVRRTILEGTEATITVPSRKQPVTCRVLDFTGDGGLRIETSRPLKEGDTVEVRSELFGSEQAVCVWKHGKQNGLRFSSAA